MSLIRFYSNNFVHKTFIKEEMFQLRVAGSFFYELKPLGKMLLKPRGDHPPADSRFRP